MTRIKRKTFIIKRFTRITEQTYLQKKQNKEKKLILNKRAKIR